MKKFGKNSFEFNANHLDFLQEGTDDIPEVTISKNVVSFNKKTLKKSCVALVQLSPRGIGPLQIYNLTFKQFMRKLR